MATVKDSIKKDPRGLIARAFAFSEKAHGGQKRKTGDPYFTHAIATANILAEWRMDEATIAAGLLHDTVEDTGIAIEAIQREFGEEVAFLVDGVTKLGRIKYRGAEGKVENLRKMILSLSQDLRVVFIKLADRLHNMRTLAALPPAKQKRIAMETDEIYSTLAYRLGMQNLAGELRDLAFPYLHPQEYRWLRETSKEQYESRLAYLEKIRPAVHALLEKHSIRPLTIDFRAKRYSSLYHKLIRHSMDIGKVYDLVAMRVIVETIPECYAVLGVIHEQWPPLPGRIKDYIAMPKPNSYRSLHTTVIGPEEKIIEFQVRTKEMHDENEYGIAAHWLYEQKRHGSQHRAPSKMAEEVQWVQQLKEWVERYRNNSSASQGQTDAQEFLQSVKTDFFGGRIFAITPKGDVVDLPKEATPVDFAYHIHSEIGNSCVGAKVNNQLVPLDHHLRSGDLVEILTQKGKKPSEDWLKFVKTAVARDHIRAVLRGKKQLAKNVPTKAELRIVVEDRPGLLKDMSTVVARSHFNILNFELKNPPGGRFPVNRMEVNSTDKQKLEKLVWKLKQVKGVREVGYKLV